MLLVVPATNQRQRLVEASRIIVQDSMPTQSKPGTLPGPATKGSAGPDLVQMQPVAWIVATLLHVPSLRLNHEQAWATYYPIGESPSSIVRNRALEAYITYLGRADDRAVETGPV